jgi:hypothetical protein
LSWYLKSAQTVIGLTVPSCLNEEWETDNYQSPEDKTNVRHADDVGEKDSD